MNNTSANLIRAQGEAMRLNRRFGGRRPGALEFEDVAMALGVLVIEGGLSGAAARLVRGETGGRIRINSKITSEGARRFAIGHELGHWQLHEKHSQMFLCTEENLRDYAQSVMEVEANFFASELLMPTALFRPLMEKEEPSLLKIGEWSKLFRASLTATTLRFIRNTKHDCFAVYSQGGRIKWWFKREDARRIWLSNGQEISRDSIAWECFQGVAPPEQMEEVPTDAWFAHLPFDLNGSVMEESLAMPRYDAVFSLLWVS